MSALSWPDSVDIREVGPRDGLQIEAPVSTDGKRRLIDALVATGIGRIEATAFVSPRAVPAMADADRYVDVTSVVQTKMDAVWCHWSQNGEADGDREWMFENRVGPPMVEAGERIGCRYAERFRRIPVRG